MSCGTPSSGLKLVRMSSPSEATFSRYAAPSVAMLSGAKYFFSRSLTPNFFSVSVAGCGAACGSADAVPVSAENNARGEVNERIGFGFPSVAGVIAVDPLYITEARSNVNNYFQGQCIFSSYSWHGVGRTSPET